MQEGNLLESELMTEAELITYLRIPEVSNSKNHHNVIENLKRMHNLPRIHVCGKPLYPREAIREWIKEKTTNCK
jgi:tRNA G37 N-methylase TrmD